MIQRLKKALKSKLLGGFFKVNWLMSEPCESLQSSQSRGWLELGAGGAAWSSHTAWHFSHCFPLPPDCKAALGKAGGTEVLMFVTLSVNWIKAATALTHRTETFPRCSCPSQAARKALWNQRELLLRPYDQQELFSSSLCAFLLVLTI